jgi:hypothetical protein
VIERVTARLTEALEKPLLAGGDEMRGARDRLRGVPRRFRRRRRADGAGEGVAHAMRPGTAGSPGGVPSSSIRTTRRPLEGRLLDAALELIEEHARGAGPPSEAVELRYKTFEPVNGSRTDRALGPAASAGRRRRARRRIGRSVDRKPRRWSSRRRVSPYDARCTLEA